jgi:hypothetical protein
MGHFAAVNDGDGLEGSVGMRTYPARGAGGRELMRAGVIEQQERAYRLTLGGRQQRTHGKSVANPMPARCLKRSQNLSHHQLLSAPTSPACWREICDAESGMEDLHRRALRFGHGTPAVAVGTTV